MLDYRQVTLKPMTPKQRRNYTQMLHNAVRYRFDPVEALYGKYKKVPSDVAARLMHMDMQKPGWDTPDPVMVNIMAAHLEYVQWLFEMCSQYKTIHGKTVDGKDYIDESNRQEVYKYLLKLHADEDHDNLARAAASFVKGTQGGFS